MSLLSISVSVETLDSLIQDVNKQIECGRVYLADV